MQQEIIDRFKSNCLKFLNQIWNAKFSLNSFAKLELKRPLKIQSSFLIQCCSPFRSTSLIFLQRAEFRCFLIDFMGFQDLWKKKRPLPKKKFAFHQIKFLSLPQSDADLIELRKTLVKWLYMMCTHFKMWPHPVFIRVVWLKIKELKILSN